MQRLWVQIQPKFFSGSLFDIAEFAFLTAIVLQLFCCSFYPHDYSFLIPLCFSMHSICPISNLQKYHGYLLVFFSKPLPEVDVVLYESRLGRQRKRKHETNNDGAQKDQGQKAIKVCRKYCVSMYFFFFFCNFLTCTCMTPCSFSAEFFLIYTIVK